MTKHSLRLNPAEVLELSTSWQEEEQAKAIHAAAARRTGAALFTVLARHDLTDLVDNPWRIRADGDDVMLEAEVPDPKPKDPPKLEGAALCAVEGHMEPVDDPPGQRGPCPRCGEFAIVDLLSNNDPKPAVGGPGSKLTPAQAKRARRKKTTVKP